MLESIKVILVVVVVVVVTLVVMLKVVVVPEVRILWKAQMSDTRTSSGIRSITCQFIGVTATVGVAVSVKVTVEPVMIDGK